MRLFPVIPLFLFTAVLIAAACSDGETSTPMGADADQPIHAVASTPVIAEWLHELAGNHVTVTTLSQSGADEHTLQLTPGQVTAIATADLVVLNGAGLETSYGDTVRRNIRNQLLVLSDKVPLDPFPTGFATKGQASEDSVLDPHFWLDPERAIIAIEAIRDSLAMLDPDHASTYATNAARYIDHVHSVDAEVRTTLADLTPERRLLVSLHNAYGYFARRYGLEILSFAVEGPEAELSAADVAALITIMQERGAPFIFREPQYDARVVEQVARESGARVRTLYAQPAGDAPTYVEMLRANARTISE